MTTPTFRQLELLKFISDYRAANDYSPSIRQIGAELGIKSTNGVNDHLKALVRKGLLTRAKTTARSLVVTPKGARFLMSATTEGTFPRPTGLLTEGA